MFSTPAFIFISEFLLARSYPDGVPDGFLKKRGKVIFVPFLFIAAIDALLMTSAMGGEVTFLAFVQKYLANVFLGNFIGYFILVIFQFYMLHMMFHEVLEKSIAEMGAVYLICGDSRLFRLFLRSQPGSCF